MDKKANEGFEKTMDALIAYLDSHYKVEERLPGKVRTNYKNRTEVVYEYDEQLTQVMKKRIKVLEYVQKLTVIAGKRSMLYPRVIYEARVRMDDGKQYGIRLQTEQSYALQFPWDTTYMSYSESCPLGSTIDTMKHAQDWHALQDLTPLLIEAVKESPAYRLHYITGNLKFD